MRLSATDIGNGAPAVFLHGQPGNAGDWHPVTIRLRERMRVIALDRPGYGRTGGRAVGFHDNAAAMVALLDRLDIESALVAAHSWATGVALAAAIRFPERVRALVLAAPVAPDIPLGLVDRALAHPLVGPVAARVGFGLAGLGLAFPPVQRLARAAVPALSPDQVAATAAQWRADGVWRSFYAEQRALVAELPLLAPHLNSVSQPTTILHGTRDRISTPAHARQLAHALPHAQLVPVDRASHMLPQQRPGLVAEAIARAAA
ncbi:MAG: alpha/beta hydrolase [Solirubrobacterales bacterium]